MCAHVGPVRRLELECSGHVGGVTVLIIDDEALVATALMRQLRALGAKTLVLANPLGAEATIEREQVRAVICDKRMPGRSGVEVLAAVRQRFPQVVRCLLSGSLSELSQLELERITPCLLLRKPWSNDELRGLLQSAGVTVS